jgi:ADP-heptose:LPS heptosyltransferase
MIAIAPLSNDALRNWPRAHYERLIDLCLQNLDREIVLVGSAEQRQAINLIVRGRPAGRLANAAGQWSWAETIQMLSEAELIIANNSGIAHVGASLARPTLCLFAASHDPHEWGPRGPHVTTLFLKTACSPCALSTANGCYFGHACMEDLRPESVFHTVQRILGSIQ